MRIALDPGHGGPDFGAISGEFYEAEYNFYMAKLFQDHLLCVFPSWASYILREQDEDPAFAIRSERAKEFRSDLVLSLHVNANDSHDVFGAMAFHNHDDVIGEEVANAILRAYPVPIYRSARRSITVNDQEWRRAANVIKQYTCPVALIELGFLTNANDLQALNKTAVQFGISQALLCGCLRLWQIKS
jgi:N-acetylmuramoyl-L-alanine amidase